MNHRIIWQSDLNLKNVSKGIFFGGLPTYIETIEDRGKLVLARDSEVLKKKYAESFESFMVKVKYNINNSHFRMAEAPKNQVKTIRMLDMRLKVTATLH